jgi:hypothetical protein
MIAFIIYSRPEKSTIPLYPCPTPRQAATPKTVTTDYTDENQISPIKPRDVHTTRKRASGGIRRAMLGTKWNEYFFLGYNHEDTKTPSKTQILSVLVSPDPAAEGGLRVLYWTFLPQSHEGTKDSKGFLLP